MKPTSKSVPRALTRRALFAAPVGALIPSVGARNTEYRFHHDHVLGTSLDLVLNATSLGEMDANAAHAAVFDEIERLTKVLISRWSGAGCSQDLSAVLDAYSAWQRRCSGAISAWFGGRINVDALGKAYIADRAVDAAVRAAPAITGLLLNIGGDIVVRGAIPRSIGIADPAARADNAPPITAVRVADCAVATSGIYERGGSHLIDPRTGFPATGAASATVIAGDSITANALATTLCVLTPDQGMRLVDATPGAAAILIARDGCVSRSTRFAAFEQQVRVVPAQAAANWPPGYELSVTFTLKEIQGYRVRRPYVAVWAEDLGVKLVRNIAVWANKPRWMPELHSWWTRNNASMDVYSITKPTRSPGRYRVVWDGLDDHGHAVPAGTYRILVETNREHGDYAKQYGSKPGKLALKETSEFGEVLIEYGPRSQTL
jgi:hypothetical protein